jgi:hypothetical protein
VTGGGGNLDLYATYTRGADANDLRRFGAFLLGALLTAVDEETARTALEAAADDVNRERS